MVFLFSAGERNTRPNAHPFARMALRVKTSSRLLALVFLLPIGVRSIAFATGDHPRDWRQANWSSTGLLVPAAVDPQARVLVLAARNANWRSIFAVHTWIVIKPANASSYTRYDVTGFGRPIRVNAYPPDARWFSAMPEVVADIRGPLAAAAIPKIEAAIENYPYAGLGDYRLWPGPNSNTFVANVLRAAPELHIAVPPDAIGKDFRIDGLPAGLTPSHTGIEVSLYGVLGLKVGWVEGIELNVLTLVAGLDLRRPALKLPGFGRIGFESTGPTPASAEAR